MNLGITCVNQERVGSVVGCEHRVRVTPKK